MTSCSLNVPILQAALTHHVFVCTGTSCSANGSEAVLEALRTELESRGLLFTKKGNLDGRVLVTTCGSMGLCAVGPALLIYPQGIWYQGVQPTDIPEIIDATLLQGQVIERLLAKTWESA